MLRNILAILAIAFFSFSLQGVVHRGQLYDPYARPIEGAQITAYPPSGPIETIERAISGADREPIARATSDAGGAFSIELPAERVVMLEVVAESFLPARIHLRPNQESGAWQLQRAERITGRVSHAGEPVTGVSLVWLSSGGNVVAAARTDEKGIYTVPDPRGLAAVVVAHHPSYALTYRTLTGPGRIAGSGLDLDLDAGQLVDGSVVDPAGNPVVGAEVRIGGWKLGVTDAEGQFSVQLGDDQRALIKIGSSIADVSVRTSGAVHTLSPGAALSGRVSTNGAGIAGALVTVNGSHFQSSTITDAQGRYELGALPREQYAIFVIATGYDIEEPWAKIDLRRVDEGVRNFDAKKTAVVAGRVTDEEGRGVAGTVVTILPDGWPFLYAYPLAPAIPVTDAEGRFRVEGQSGDRNWSISALHPHHPLARVGLKPGQPVEIQFGSGVRVAGRIRNPEGEGVGAEIAVVSAGTLEPGESSAVYFDGSKPFRWLHEAADDGSFELTLSDTTVDLLAHAPGYAMGTRAGFQPAATESLEIELRRGYSVGGTLVREEGEPVAEAFIALRIGGSPVVYGATDGEGRFQFGDLEALEYEIVASDGQVESDPISVNPPASDLKIVLPTGIAIKGRVVDDETGAPIDTFSVIAKRNGEMKAVGTAARSGDGSFTIRVTAPGTYVLEPHVKGYLTTESEPVEVAASLPLPPLELRATRGRVVRGTIRDEHGNAISGVQISPEIVNGNFSFGESATSDDVGQYELAGLPRRISTIEFTSDEALSTKIEVDLTETNEEKLDVTMTRGLSLRGRVVDENGEPLARITVTASTPSAGAEARSSTTDSGGRFAIGGLIDVPYTVEAGGAGRESESLRNVEPRRDADLLLRLRRAPTGTIIGHIEGGHDEFRAVFASTDSSYATGVVDEHGDYRIEDVGVGSVTVVLHSGTTSVTRHTRISAGAEVRVDFDLAGGITLEGRVIRNGIAVPRASVKASAVDGSHEGNITADSDGSFRIDGLAAGGYRIEISDHGPTHVMTLELQVDRKIELDITGGSVEGTIVDANGRKPVAGASVEVRKTGEYASVAEVTTDGNGQYRVDGIQRGTYVVRARHPSHAQARTEVDIDPPAAAVANLELFSTEGIVVVLIDALTRQPLYGTVVAQDMRNVVVFDGEPERVGKGVRLPLLEGEYKISASADGFATTTVPIAGLNSELVIPLSQGGNVIIHSTRPTPRIANLLKPNGDLYIKCWCNQIAELKVEGLVTRFENIEAGSYSLLIHEPEGEVSRYPLNVVEGQTVEVAID